MAMDLEALAQKIVTETSAKSVFSYGSHARNEVVGESDYEVGVLYEESKYKSRSELEALFGNENLSIFPFKLEGFINGSPDTPFQKTLYLRDTILTGRTIGGEKIIENLKLPSVYLVDLIQETRFNLGYALAATHSFRNNDIKTAILHFVKSNLFGARNLVIFELKQYPTLYSEIVKLATNLNLGIFKELADNALQLRLGKTTLDSAWLFQNISFLNQYVEPKLVSTLEKEGNIILIS
jgi:hypothetical protein